MATKKLAMDVVVEEQSQVMIFDEVIDSFQNTKFVVWDFGQVEEEVTRMSTLSIRANYDFDLEIESKNEGALVYTDQVASSSKIPYRMTLGQQNLDLKKGRCQIPVDTTSLMNLPISLTIFPDPDTNFAGSYQDLILLSIISRT